MDVAIEWVASPAERFEFKKADNTYLVLVSLPDETKNEDLIEFKLTATGKYESTNVTKDFTGYLLPFKPLQTAITIADAIKAEEGTQVTVRGVTAKARNNDRGFFIVDETGVIYVYDATKSEVLWKFQYGNEVLITATRSANNGTYSSNSVQLAFDADSIMTLMSIEVKPIPTAASILLTCTEFATWKKDGTEDYAGGLYKVEGYIEEYNQGNFKIYEVVDDAGKYIHFYASDQSVYTTEFAEYLADSTVEDMTTRSNIKVNVYLAVYDAKLENGVVKNWRVSPLLVERANNLK